MRSTTAPAGGVAVADRAAPARADLRPTAAPHALPLRGATVATLLVGYLLPMIDFFIVNVALPTMARDLHAGEATLELVVSGYAVAYAVLLVLGGRLGDALGRKPLFLAGTVAFTVASLLCGLAPGAGTLVVARVLQGASAALLVPQVLATIQSTGTPASRSRALGWYGAAGGIAAAGGQLLGGVLVNADLFGSGWRPVFLVNVPVGVVGFLLAARLVPDTRSSAPSRLDLRGTALLAVALTALLVPLTEGRALHWPAWSWLLLAAAPVVGVVLVLVERAQERQGLLPLLPPSLVTRPTVRRGLLLAGPFFAGFGAFMFVIALVTQGALGYSPLRAGLAIAPMALAFLGGSLLTTPLVARHGRSVITAGALLQAVGIAGLVLTLLSTWPHVTPLDLAPSTVVMGLGQSFILSPLFRVVLGDVPVASAGAASGVLVTTQQVALALGVALLGTLYVSLATSASWGPRDALVVVLTIQGVVALGVAAGSRLLPER
ncbi:MAG: MFS transporter [Motilibacteraceae bacterium]